MHCAQSARSLALLAIIPIAGLAELETTANVTSCGGVGGGRERMACLPRLRSGCRRLLPSLILETPHGHQKVVSEIVTS